MRIEWKTGRPEIDGEYVVVYDNSYVTTLSFTKKYGWNTVGEIYDYAMMDDEIVAWAEPFGKHVIDIYGNRDKIKEGGE